MFVLTTLVYPAALAALCLGAGLLTDRCSGRSLPGPLLVSVGAATLIAVSQLATYAHAIAPATPYLMAAFAVAGFALATAVGPAWLLARRIGLDGAWAALAASSITLPALVYAYELLGSVKEITAVAMILTLGCFVAMHRHWLRGPPARAIPFALVL